MTRYRLYARGKASRKLHSLGMVPTRDEAKAQIKILRAASKARNDNTHSYSYTQETGE
jgi:hypothetical protein